MVYALHRELTPPSLHSQSIQLDKGSHTSRRIRTNHKGRPLSRRSLVKYLKINNCGLINCTTAGQRNTPRSYLRVWSPVLGSCLIESPFVHTCGGLEVCTVGGKRDGGYYTLLFPLSQTPVTQFNIQWLYFDLFYSICFLRTVRKKNPCMLPKESWLSWQVFPQYAIKATARGRHRGVFFLDIPDLLTSNAFVQPIGHFV